MQPHGILHGGSSVVLAETLGSIAAQLHRCVGLEINANHIKPATSGLVTGTATALHIGRRTQVWDIRLHNEENQLTCISRMTVALIPIKAARFDVLLQ